MIKYDLHPGEDRLVVRPDAAEERTQAGLYIPDTAKDRPQIGTVIARGEGRWEHGHYIANPYYTGERVLFGKYAGQPVELNDEELMIIRSTDVLARVSEVEVGQPHFDATGAAVLPA
jgi:chaperonin GroES